MCIRDRLYLMIYLGSIVGFCMVYNTWFFLFDNILGGKHYKAMDDTKKAYYLTNFLANTHHVVIISYAMISVKQTCGGFLGWL